MNINIFLHMVGSDQPFMNYFSLLFDTAVCVSVGPVVLYEWSLPANLKALSHLHWPS